MAHRFYFDVHVTAAAAFRLRRQGVDVLRVQEIGAERLSEPQHLEQALRLGRILVTQDTDFLALANAAHQDGKTVPTVVFSRQSIALGDLIADLELIATTEPPEAATGLVFYLPIRT